MEDLRWKNRIVLVITDSEESLRYDQQIKALEPINSDFTERKLILIDVRKDKFRIRFDGKKNTENSSWIMNAALYKMYALNADDLTIVLLGLDGGIKIRQGEIISRTELFNTIDAMPMRRAEMEIKH